MRTFCLRIADWPLVVETAALDLFESCPNYVPFSINQKSKIKNLKSKIFTLRISEEPLTSNPLTSNPYYIDRSDEDMPRVEIYRNDDGWLFRIAMTRDADIISEIQCDASMQHAVLYGEPTRFAIDNALMLLYAFTTANRRTLLFHASVIVREAQAYLFLGKSGTGKSTHAQQWLKAFPDAELINDDNPVVRILENGEVRVYGSPWSGKTPCYKAVSAPVRALVQLAQAPQNEFRFLRPSQAYPYILSSVSGLKMLPSMMDALYDSIAQLLETTPVGYLDCLPEPSAATLCYSHLLH